MYFSLPLVVVLSLVSAAVASPMPMKVTPVAGVGNSADKPATADNIKNSAGKKAIIDASLVKANEHIGKMKTVLNDPTNAKNKGLIVSAFGQQAYDKNLASIKDTVSNIDKANVRTRLTTQKTGAFTDPKTIGVTKWLEDGKTKKWEPDSVSYGAPFFDSKTSTETRAGTMIHEAAHYAGKAGDHFDPKTKKITVDPPGSDMTGYTKSHVLPKTVAAVTADKGYTAVRDKATNMHQNAESYAVFASLCANARRDLQEFDNFRRALQVRDYDEIQNVLRRGGKSCSLPPDYFKKKAAAQAAKTGKTAAADKKLPGAKSATGKGAKSLLAGGKTAKGVATRPGAKSAGVKGGKSLLAGGKTAKGLTTRPGAKPAAGRGTKGAKSQLGGKTAKGLATRPGAKSAAGRGAKGAKSPLGGAKTAKGVTARPGAKAAAGRGAKGAKSPLGGAKAGKGVTARPGAKAAAGRGAKGAKSPLGGKTAKGLATRPGAKPAAGRGAKGAKSLPGGAKAAKGVTARPGAKSAAGRGAKGAKSVPGGKAAKGPTTRPGAKSTAGGGAKVAKSPAAGGKAAKGLTGRPGAQPGAKGAKSPAPKAASAKAPAPKAASAKAPAPKTASAKAPAPKAASAKAPAPAPAARTPPKGKKV